MNSENSGRIGNTGISDLTWEGGHVLELDEQECWDLVRSREVGRIAWSGPGGITVHPVNHVVQDGHVWLRTTAYAALTREADESPVAFQVDEIDDVTRGGWSVLVRGTAHLTWPDDAQHPQIESWAGGVRPVFVQVRPREVTGRRLLPS